MNPFVRAIGQSYQTYEEKLIESNSIDFAHQHKLFYELLRDADIRKSIAERLGYVMVDEYQDTNYVHEQQLLDLPSDKEILCMVGDHDQARCRLRGALVTNIL